jgi:hypothetical protein
LCYVVYIFFFTPFPDFLVNSFNEVKDLVQQTKKMNDYNSNKLKYMMDWSDMVLDKYSKDTIYKLMEDTYLNDFNMKVKFVCVVLPV